MPSWIPIAAIVAALSACSPDRGNVTRAPDSGSATVVTAQPGVAPRFRMKGHAASDATTNTTATARATRPFRMLRTGCLPFEPVYEPALGRWDTASRASLDSLGTHLPDRDHD